jgi:hypothetical protein
MFIKLLEAFVLSIIAVITLPNHCSFRTLFSHGNRNGQEVTILGNMGNASKPSHCAWHGNLTTIDQFVLCHAEEISPWMPIFTDISFSLHS